jgi:branched-chain amino acid transport system permease protein
MTALADLCSILLGGLSAGMVLFIVSVGLSITMGLMGVVNLAHGGFAMLGGYVVAKVMLVWGIPFIGALGIGFVVIALFSIVLEQLLYVHYYNATELDQVLFTVGLLFVMTASVTLLFGPESQHIALPPWLQGQVNLGLLEYRTYSLFLIVCGACIAGLLVLGFEKTRFGSEIRAAVDNRRMAESMGVDVRRLFMITFALGSGLAALGGGLGAEFLGLDPQYPFKYLVYFLIVVAIGTGKQISGVFYASLLIGILDFVLKKYIPRGGTLFVFGLTIILLLWRPKGLFSRGPK